MKLRSQLRPTPSSSCLKKDEGVFPFLGRHSFHPFNQIILVVSSAPQTQVTPLCRTDDFSERLFIRV